MRNRESEGYTDSAVEDSTRAPLLSRRRVHKTLSLKSLSWIAVLTERALSTRSSAVHAQQRCGSRALARLASQEAGSRLLHFPMRVLPENLACPQGIFNGCSKCQPQWSWLPHTVATACWCASILRLGGTVTFAFLLRDHLEAVLPTIAHTTATVLSSARHYEVIAI